MTATCPSDDILNPARVPMSSIYQLLGVFKSKMLQVSPEFQRSPISQIYLQYLQELEDVSSKYRLIVNNHSKDTSPIGRPNRINILDDQVNFLKNFLTEFEISEILKQLTPSP